MTTLRCAWCGNAFEQPNRKGPVPRYCGGSCRQRAFEERRLDELIDQRDRAVRALARARRVDDWFVDLETEELLAEPWAQAVLDGE